MTSPEPAVVRTKLHTRQIVIDGYRRSDGLWEIEGRLTDVRTQDIPLRTGVRRAGSALHEMFMRITVDETLTIRSASAATLASPYPGTCENIAPDYSKLEGVRIVGGFRREVLQLFGGLRGCTHMTELIGNIGTAAIQTIGPELEKKSDQRPGKLDGCHALDSTGSVVAYYYPTWYRKPE